MPEPLLTRDEILAFQMDYNLMRSASEEAMRSYIQVPPPNPHGGEIRNIYNNSWTPWARAVMDYETAYHIDVHSRMIGAMIPWLIEIQSRCIDGLTLQELHDLTAIAVMHAENAGNFEGVDRLVELVYCYMSYAHISYAFNVMLGDSPEPIGAEAEGEMEGGPQDNNDPEGWFWIDELFESILQNLNKLIDFSGTQKAKAGEGLLDKALAELRRFGTIIAIGLVAYLLLFGRKR